DGAIVSCREQRKQLRGQERRHLVVNRRSSFDEEALELIELAFAYVPEDSQAERLRQRRFWPIEHRAHTRDLDVSGPGTEIQAGACSHVGGIRGAFGGFESPSQLDIRVQDRGRNRQHSMTFLERRVVAGVLTYGGAPFGAAIVRSTVEGARSRAADRRRQ